MNVRKYVRSGELLDDLMEVLESPALRHIAHDSMTKVTINVTSFDDKHVAIFPVTVSMKIKSPRSKFIKDFCEVFEKEFKKAKEGLVNTIKVLQTKYSKSIKEIDEMSYVFAEKVFIIEMSLGFTHL